MSCHNRFEIQMKFVMTILLCVGSESSQNIWRLFSSELSVRGQRAVQVLVANFGDPKNLNPKPPRTLNP